MNPNETRSGANYTAAELGPAAAWKSYTAEVASLPGVKIPGKFFLQPLLGLTGMEVSLNCLPAGMKVPFYHTHRTHEELYVFLKGTGQFLVDGEVIEIAEGTMLRVSPDGERAWRNNSQEDLYYLVIQAPQGGLTAPGTEDGVTVQRKVSWPA
jgi:mannose-6-phosphate isomerase-like protein (cupin superfamily)